MSRIFFADVILIDNSISLFLFSFLLEFVLVICVFQRICTLHLNCYIHWHKVVQNNSLFFFNTHRIFSDVPSLIHHDTGTFCLLSFLISLGSVSLNLLIFQRASSWFQLFCLICFLFSVLLISSLYYFLLST